MKKVVGKKVLILLFLLLFLPLFSGCFLAPMNHAPVITATPITAAKVGELYIYDVEADDLDGDTLTCSLTTCPIGMTIDSLTGEISWTPISSQIGDNDVSVEVSDGEKYDTQSFRINVTDTIVVTVNPTALTSIIVDPKDMSLFIGEEEHTIISITASYNYGPDKAIALADCSYSSNNETVATVATGVVTGVADGSATITISYEENGITKTDTVVVTVSPIELISITVLPDTMSLFVGEEHTLNSITVSYNYGPDKTLTLTNCNYCCNIGGIASVCDGVVIGLAEGTDTITANYTEGTITKADTVVVTVNPTALTFIIVDPKDMSLFIGEEEHTIISITASYNYGPDKAIALADCSYSSDNETVATVAAGVVTGVGAGSATITLSYTEGTITESDTVAVTVNPIPPNLELLPHTQNAKIGESFSINVEVENALDLLGASITLNFDHVAMPFLSAIPGSFFSNVDILADLSGPLGSITLNLVSLVGPASGTGTIMIVSFIAAMKGNNYPITFGVTELRDKDDKIIVHTTGSGCKVHIKKP